MRGIKVIEVVFCKENPESIELEYVVIAARYNGQWLFVRHKERQTYEMPGGHIELGEDCITAAKRELYEETGAKDFSLDFICIYTVTMDDRKSGGYLFFADIKTLSQLPDFEMAERALYDSLPESLTYPLIQPHLFNHIIEWMTSHSVII